MLSRPRISWLVLALTFALAAAALMALHTVRHAIRMHGARETVRPWMSIPYIARSRHVPIQALYEAIELPPDRRDRRPVGRIARQQGRPVEQLIAKLEATIAKTRAHPPPHQGSPP